MTTYKALITWTRQGSQFVDGRFSRRHQWSFDGGIEVPASSSPHVVPLPLSTENAVDPEEALVAALSSCHMLCFLAIAAKNGYCVDDYRDDAEGIMAKNEIGRLAMTVVTLKPDASFAGRQPTRVQLEEMHHEAHERCFIANSVKTDVRCEISPARD